MAALGGYIDFQARAYQPSAHRSGPLEFVEPERNSFQFREQWQGGNTGIEQRAEKHVAADSGGAVEVRSLHISLGRLGCRFRLKGPRPSTPRSAAPREAPARARLWAPPKPRRVLCGSHSPEASGEKEHRKKSVCPPLKNCQRKRGTGEGGIFRLNCGG